MTAVDVVSDFCMCGYEYRNAADPAEWCPRCWPERQPVETQLSLFDDGKEQR